MEKMVAMSRKIGCMGDRVVFRFSSNKMYKFNRADVWYSEWPELEKENVLFIGESKAKRLLLSELPSSSTDTAYSSISVAKLMQWQGADLFNIEHAESGRDSPTWKPDSGLTKDEFTN